MDRKPASPAAPTGLATAYSYVRFSKPEQATGDSVRRQEARRDAWLAKSGAVLDTSLSLRDLGVSAFTGSHRQNPDRHALAAFLDFVQRGRIRRGSYLVVESLDRLSREDTIPALSLLLGLITAGIRVVQLTPVEETYDDKSDPFAIMRAIMELSRAHAESARKSDLIRPAWSRKKHEDAAQKKLPISTKVPAWVKVIGDPSKHRKPTDPPPRFVLIEPAAAAVKRIFHLAASGYGSMAIAKKLNAEKVPAIGRSGTWQQIYVHKILHSRSVLGEFAPHAGRNWSRRPDGDVILNYFPRVISDAEWFAAQAGVASRREQRGRAAKDRVNIFTGLLFSGLDGGPVWARFNSGGSTVSPAKARSSVEGTSGVSFPLAALEWGVLSRLRELDPREILPGGNDTTGRVTVAAAKLAEVEGRIARAKANMTDGDGDVRAIMDALRELDQRHAAAAEELAAAEREAATPLAAAWGEAKTLAEIVADAPDPDEVRHRLRSALRRIASRITCVFAVRGSVRISAVQMNFKGGATRQWLILHRQANANARREAQTLVRSLVDVAGADRLLDLADRADARALADLLPQLPVLDLLAADAKAAEPPVNTTPARRKKETTRG